MSGHVDAILGVVHQEACAEMWDLTRGLHPNEDVLTSEIIGIVGILRGALGRKSGPPKAPKPEPGGESNEVGQDCMTMEPNAAS